MAPAEKEPDMTTYSGMFSANIRDLRKQKGLSLETVVKKINKLGWEITLAAYRHWENGTRQPKLDAIPYVSKALGVTPHDILPDKIILKKPSK